jgi:hypothetical protein
MDRTRTLLLRYAKSLTDKGRDGGWTDDLTGHFGQRCHGGYHIHHLKPRLLATEDAFLPGKHHHGHGAEESIGGARCQVESAGTQGRQAYSGPAGEPAMGRRHERGCLLMPSEHQLDGRAAQRLHGGQVFLSGYTEDPFYALVLQGCHEPLGAIHISAPDVQPDHTSSC